MLAGAGPRSRGGVPMVIGDDRGSGWMGRRRARGYWYDSLAGGPARWTSTAARSGCSPPTGHTVFHRGVPASRVLTAGRPTQTLEDAGGCQGCPGDAAPHPIGDRDALRFCDDGGPGRFPGPSPGQRCMSRGTKRGLVGGLAGPGTAGGPCLPMRSGGSGYWPPAGPGGGGLGDVRGFGRTRGWWVIRCSGASVGAGPGREGAGAHRTAVRWRSQPWLARSRGGGNGAAAGDGVRWSFAGAGGRSGRVARGWRKLTLGRTPAG